MGRTRRARTRAARAPRAPQGTSTAACARGLSPRSAPCCTTARRCRQTARLFRLWPCWRRATDPAACRRAVSVRDSAGGAFPCELVCSRVSGPGLRHRSCRQLESCWGDWGAARKHSQDCQELELSRLLPWRLTETRARRRRRRCPSSAGTLLLVTHWSGCCWCHTCCKVCG